MGHPQDSTPIATDNTTTTAFVHKKMVMKKPKSWDMNLHRLRDKEVQTYFRLFWEKGFSNQKSFLVKMLTLAVTKYMY